MSKKKEKKNSCPSAFDKYTEHQYYIIHKPPRAPHHHHYYYSHSQRTNSKAVNSTVTNEPMADASVVLSDCAPDLSSSGSSSFLSPSVGALRSSANLLSPLQPSVMQVRHILMRTYDGIWPAVSQRSDGASTSSHRQERVTTSRSLTI